MFVFVFFMPWAGFFHVGAPRWGSRSSSGSVSLADQTHFMPFPFQHSPEKNVLNLSLLRDKRQILCADVKSEAVYT